MGEEIWHGPGRPPPALCGAIGCIGNFDGVHRGHKALIGEGRALATAQGRPLLLVTFEPHPRSMFRPDEPVFRLTDAETRRALARDLGCAGVVELPFDRTMSSLPADRFVTALLIESLALAGAVVGEDFAFGHGRGGDVALLRELFAAAGGVVRSVPAVRDATGQVVSSSRVRACLEAGDVAGAAALLGHDWFVRAMVVHGDKRGRLMGFPTANMVLPAHNRLRHGIYAVRVRVDGQWRPAVASFGRRPTFDDGAPRLESFLFDFDGDLYGQTLEVAFVAWLRGEAKFDGMEPLMAQMRADAAQARALLGA
jgi:riboflavin kinase/FMN adenylyltransferase